MISQLSTRITKVDLYDAAEILPISPKESDVSTEGINQHTQLPSVQRFGLGSCAFDMINISTLPIADLEPKLFPEHISSEKKDLLIAASAPQPLLHTKFYYLLRYPLPHV